MKKVLSLLVAFMLMFSVIPFGSLTAEAASYNASAALAYAEKNWDSGVEMCAGFVSNCLTAGGIDIMERRVCNLYNSLKGIYGTAYTLETSGPYIYLSDNSGKLSAGDPVFYYCDSCNSFQHAILCGGQDSNGRMTDYAHNNAHHNSTTYISWGCPDCGAVDWIMYSVHVAGSSAHVHSYKKTITKAATCTSKGVATYTCSCGSSYTEDVAATGHKETLVYDKFPSVYSTGTQHKECSVCHATLSSKTTVAKVTADANGDGKVNSADAIVILKYSTGDKSAITCESNKCNADANGDGKINSIDALVILNISTGSVNV